MSPLASAPRTNDLVPRPPGDNVEVVPRPFATSPDPRFVYQSASYRRTFEEVLLALGRREGLLVVTGEPGTGKTTFCRALRQELGRRARVSLVLDPCLDVDDLLAHLLTDFGVLPGAGEAPGVRALAPAGPDGGERFGRRDLVDLLQLFLTSLAVVNGYAIVLIDEAQHLDPRVLEQIRLWSNFETDTTKLLQIVLVGSTDLIELLQRPYMRSLNERVARRCELTPLTQREVAEYIEHRLRVAGGPLPVPSPGALLLRDDPAPPSLTRAALREVAVLSRGVPRRVNMLCDGALALGPGRDRIDRTLVRAAAGRVAPWRAPVRSRQARVSWARATAVAMLVAAPAAWTWGAGHFRGSPPPTPAKTTIAREAPSAAWPATPQVTAALGTLSSTEGFFVQAASGLADGPAARVVEELEAARLPAFVSHDRTPRVVVVGPYLSLDEAEAAQRILSDSGVTRTQLLRPASSRTSSASGLPNAPRLLAAAGRLSLVLDVGSEPRQVVTRPINDTTVEIEAGPLVVRPAGMELSADRAASLVTHVSVEGLTTEGASFARARLSIAAGARTNVRVAGPRLYVDIDPGRVPATPPAAGAMAAAEYATTVAAVVREFDDVAPFLLSVSESPTPDTLDALRQRVTSLAGRLRTTSVPTNAVGAHRLLTSAVALAAQAVEPASAGGRLETARRSVEQFAAAKTHLKDQLPGLWQR